MAENDKDDNSIPDASHLFRRIPPHWIVPDGKGSVRISSQGFNDPDLSCAVETCLDENGHAPEDLLAEYEECCLAAITAGLAREESQQVYHDPLEGEICHGIVEGKKNKRVSRRLAAVATDNWIIPPDNK